MSRRIVTPSGMHGNVSVSSFCLHDDLCIVYFPIFFPFIVDISTSWWEPSYSSTLYFFLSVTSSTCTHSSNYCVGSMTGYCTASACALGYFDYVLSSSSSIICCGTPNPSCYVGIFSAVGLYFSALGSTSISSVVEIYHSCSSTIVKLTSSINGEGMGVGLLRGGVNQ